jgi:hypothetical protein
MPTRHQSYAEELGLGGDPIDRYRRYQRRVDRDERRATRADHDELDARSPAGRAGRRALDGVEDPPRGRSNGTGLDG